MASQTDPPEYNPEAAWETAHSPAFAEALFALQADLPPIPRTARGQVGPRQYKYPPYEKILAKVRPVLRKHKFVWNTRPTLTIINGEVRFVLAYALRWLKTGEKDAGLYPLKEDAAQQQGSQISYAKRYALGAVLDLVVIGEDDDGHAASQPPEPQERQERRAQRTRGPVPPADDLWAGQPPGEFTPPPTSLPDRRRKPSSPAQLIAAHFKRLGIEDDEERHSWVARMAGRDELASTSNLPPAQQQEILSALSHCKDIGQVVAWIEDHASAS